MTLVLGTKNQGKLEFALAQFELNESSVHDGKEMSLKNFSDIRAINHLEALIRRICTEKQDPLLHIEKIVEFNKDVILICEDLGCVITPYDELEKQVVNKTVAICSRMARQADSVWRVYQGKGDKIK